MIASKPRRPEKGGADSSASGSLENNEECCKTGNYLRHLSGQDRETNQLILEHNYSKPWTWKPETSFAKPTRTLFTKSASKTICGPDDDLDVETIEEAQISHLQYVEEADACEKYADELRATPNRNQLLGKEDNEDWEAHVPRAGWTTEHLRLYTNVVRALHELQLARLALLGRVDEAVQRRLAVDTAARRVRRAMASVTWDLRLTHWLHATLQEHMPTPLLAIYLEVLQTLRAKAPSLIDQMLSLSTYNRLGVPVSEELLQLLQKPWDPAASSLSEHKPRKLPLDPVMVIVPSGIGNHVGHNSRRNRFWTSQLSMLGRVTTVSTQSANLTVQSTVENMLEQLLTLTRAKVDELKTAAPGRPVILVGWNVGAAIACQAALMEPVAAVVCMGFPISTLAGRRGQADDAILDLQCPILFVIGQNAPTSRQADIEELRERLRVQSGLLVVGSADEQLRVSGAKKRSEGLTQSMVDRCVLDEVGDFLGSVLTQPTSISATPLKAATLQQTISAASSSLVASADHSASRRQSSENLSNDVDAPEVKRSRSATPMPPSPASSNTTPTKIVYSGTKTETPISFSNNRTANKRVYEANTTQRVLLSSGSTSGTSLEKRGNTANLGSRQSQAGITVNIGSLASLAPIGPIRLGCSESTSDSPTRVPRPPTVRVPSTPTTNAGLTSLSSLLTANTTKIGQNSILLTSNATGHIKVLGGDDATAQSRTRQLDLSRVTLLTSGATKAAAASQGGVVMVNTGGGATSSSTGSSVLLHQQQITTKPRQQGGTLVHQMVAKSKVEQGSAKTTILQSSSAPILLSSTATTSSPNTTRPVTSLSPSQILELPVIFAKDGDPDQYMGAAALTAPLPVTISDEVAAISGITAGQDKKSQPK